MHCISRCCFKTVKHQKQRGLVHGRAGPRVLPKVTQSQKDTRGFYISLFSTSYSSVNWERSIYFTKCSEQFLNDRRLQHVFPSDWGTQFSINNTNHQSAQPPVSTTSPLGSMWLWIHERLNSSSHLISQALAPQHCRTFRDPPGTATKPPPPAPERAGLQKAGVWHPLGSSTWKTNAPTGTALLAGWHKQHVY